MDGEIATFLCYVIGLAYIATFGPAVPRTEVRLAIVSGSSHYGMLDYFVLKEDLNFFRELDRICKI